MFNCVYETYIEVSVMVNVEMYICISTYLYVAIYVYICLCVLVCNNRRYRKLSKLTSVLVLQMSTRHRHKSDFERQRADFTHAATENVVKRKHNYHDFENDLHKQNKLLSCNTCRFFRFSKDCFGLQSVNHNTQH